MVHAVSNTVNKKIDNIKDRRVKQYLGESAYNWFLWFFPAIGAQNKCIFLFTLVQRPLTSKHVDFNHNIKVVNKDIY